ncbi:hypothetical protein P5673_006312 [Acropora cervicornis]|uniref:Uncharacterized protein n=1 Tax=Acropora cervicornis TaxID=6130 RepID=A0AAD9VCL7_ACRCE|nr:hypothetical protein P5673_006312 [Acropora cervicornis]
MNVCLKAVSGINLVTFLWKNGAAHKELFRREIPRVSDEIGCIEYYTDRERWKVSKGSNVNANRHSVNDSDARKTPWLSFGQAWGNYG